MHYVCLIVQLSNFSSQDGTFANPAGDPAFDIDYSRLNPNDFTASLSAMNEFERDANKQYASQMPYDFSSLDTFNPYLPSIASLAVPTFDDTAVAQAAPVTGLPGPAFSVLPVLPAAITSSIPLAAQSQGAHPMASQAPPVSGTDLMPSNLPPVTTAGPLTPLVLPVSPATSMPTPIQVEQPIARRTCRARPSVPFNRRELDNVIGNPNRPQNKKRRVDDATDKQPAKCVSYFSC